MGMEELKEIEKRIKNSNSKRNRRDLKKYKKRILRELKKTKVGGI